MIQRCLVLSAAALVVLASPPPASAATVFKFYLNHAVSVCQPALPAFDGLIRKRPKALANEGTTTAFVSCAPGHQGDSSRTVEALQVLLINRRASSVQMACTLVDGLGDDTVSASLVKTVDVAANGSASLTWQSGPDNGGLRYGLPAVSCALSAGTEIIGLAYQAMDEIGT